MSIKVRLDPRTHLLILLLMSLLTLIAGSSAQTIAVMLLGMLYLLALGLPRKAVQYGLLFIGCKAAILALSGIVFGTFVIVFYTVSRMIPLMMVASALLACSPSAIMCAFERMRLPKNLIITICLLTRFFPVIMQEMAAIRSGMRARGIFKRWYSVLQKPALAYECFLMPLVVRCLKLSSELAASAVLRGIECTANRSSVHPIGIRAADGAAILVFIALSAGICVMVE
ncbi:energy-coupling factor transporter transmembrane component T [Paenibacillus ehimensis]|uniref:Energy-coupling factor transporter transmembrane component T n=1 Tax=Paenibacillus ehimensis TaxID=79264 RepID=A0ABT8VB87_9BACL|nr:energy-coupling factor transporter transmembrane component T [Paenibacillus ehimensis]MDO3678223.1 energy-coupling factor transporter transmembrane component T [Paenibacillus ehimensis]MEC0209730.1 energy-coupling factor transporter transmembrane component T [Paenibacillus ehimensis]